MGSHRRRQRRFRSLVSPAKHSFKPFFANCGFYRAIQYAKAQGLKVLGIDGGEDKAALCTKLGADAFIDFMKIKVWQPLELLILDLVF